MHVLGASVSVHIRRSNQRSIVQDFALLALSFTPLLELFADLLVLFADFKGETSFLFPVGPLRLILFHDVDQRLAESTFA